MTLLLLVALISLSFNLQILYIRLLKKRTAFECSFLPPITNKLELYVENNLYKN